MRSLAVSRPGRPIALRPALLGALAGLVAPAARAPGPGALAAAGLIAALVVAGLALASARDRAEAAPRGRILRMSLGAPSLGDSERSVRVYLPPSYDRPEARDRRYPVVFLLHGWPGGEGNWPGEGKAGTTLDSLIAGGRIPELIAVMPNARGAGFLGRSLYINSYDGRSRVEDFITRDLVAWVDSSFRTQPDSTDRALIGLSDGGSAAINLAFKHPDLFQGCGSHSGSFRLRRGTGEKKILGPDTTAERLMRENSPLLYLDRVAPRLKGMAIYFDCGLDDSELEVNRELDRRLAELGIPHTYHEFPGGHSWGYWRKHLRESLIAVTARMK